MLFDYLNSLLHPGSSCGDEAAICFQSETLEELSGFVKQLLKLQAALLLCRRSSCSSWKSISIHVLLLLSLGQVKLCIIWQT